jgi:hypothetical protein
LDNNIVQGSAEIRLQMPGNETRLEGFVANSRWSKQAYFCGQVAAAKRSFEILDKLEAE